MILSSPVRLYRKGGPALGMAGHMTRQRAASTKSMCGDWQERICRQTR